ncbi:protein of unknown function [Pararobbsia alpina]
MRPKRQRRAAADQRRASARGGGGKNPFDSSRHVSAETACGRQGEGAQPLASLCAVRAGRQKLEAGVRTSVLSKSRRFHLRSFKWWRLRDSQAHEQYRGLRSVIRDWREQAARCHDLARQERTDTTIPRGAASRLGRLSGKRTKLFSLRCVWRASHRIRSFINSLNGRCCQSRLDM